MIKMTCLCRHRRFTRTQLLEISLCKLTCYFCYNYSIYFTSCRSDKIPYFLESVYKKQAVQHWFSKAHLSEKEMVHGFCCNFYTKAIQNARKAFESHKIPQTYRTVIGQDAMHEVSQDATGFWKPVTRFRHENKESLLQACYNIASSHTVTYLPYSIHLGKKNNVKSHS